MQEDMNAPPKRRWTFRLRTLLLVVLFAATIAAWIGNRIHNDRVQKHLARSIAEKGGYVWLDVVGPFIDVEFHPSPPGRGCGQVHCLASPNGTTGTFTDNDVALIKKLKHLRSVDFTNTSVSQEAISQFRRAQPNCQVVSSP